jgi:hypothetical protein
MTMKTAFRRWWLSHKLRNIARDLDLVYADRRNTVRAEQHLRRKADAVNAELMRLLIRGDRA